MTTRRNASIGVGEALLAYSWWGVVTGLYFNELNNVHALELLTWRVFAGLPLMFLLLWRTNAIGGLVQTMRDPRAMRPLFLSAILIGINWFTFIYAILTERLVQASLGYFINPLVSILLARLILGERVSPLQRTAIAIATAGVIVFVFTIISESSNDLAGIPWIPFILPLSFGLYGLLRKQMRADSATGLTIEMCLLLPLMLALEGWLLLSGNSIVPTASPSLLAMLVLGGVVTIVPLIAFAAAARRLRLTTLSLLQYLAPLGQFVLALVLGESFGAGKAAAFALILAAITVYSIDAIKATQARQP